MDIDLMLDCDIHERVPFGEVVARVDEKWKKHLLQYSWDPGRESPYPISSAAGLNRADSNLADGRPGGSDLGLLRRHVFEDTPITHGILLGGAPGIPAPIWPGFGTAITSAYNDAMAARWLDNEPRLFGSIHVDATDPDGAVREIERLAGNDRMIQVMMTMSRAATEEPAFIIYQTAQKYGLPVAFHVGGDYPTAYGMHRYYIEWKTLVTQAFEAFLTLLIFNGLLARNPEIRILLVEGGFTWVPSLMQRADHLYQLGSSEVPWLDRLPSEIIRDQVKFTTQPMVEMDARTLETYLDLMKTDRLLCFSSDYPHWDFDSPTEAFPQGLSQATLKRIYFGNASEFYGERLKRGLAASEDARNRQATSGVPTPTSGTVADFSMTAADLQ